MARAAQPGRLTVETAQAPLSGSVRRRERTKADARWLGTWYSSAAVLNAWQDLAVNSSP
ncbi:hypothetical protein K438DRAFT_1848870 [Mycena galopus ATCC 62051]|nr:hypothetical protein K438DRAFT_1848870 [Mycena galopus ATCC 62051]